MKSETIKLIYLYTFSSIGLILIVLGSIKITDIFLRMYIFKDADKIYSYFPENFNETEQNKKIQMDILNSERQKAISYSISMIIVGLPLFIYHWNILRKNYFE